MQCVLLSQEEIDIIGISKFARPLSQETISSTSFIKPHVPSSVGGVLQFNRRLGVHNRTCWNFKRLSSQLGDRMSIPLDSDWAQELVEVRENGGGVETGTPCPTPSEAEG
jgi:hypothetical protein